MSTAEQNFEEWADKKFDSDTGDEWWCVGRKKLNVIIRLVNEWTLDGRPQEQVKRLLHRIDTGIKGFELIDGGSGWVEFLESMREYVVASDAVESGQPLAHTSEDEIRVLHDALVQYLEHDICTARRSAIAKSLLSRLGTPL